MDRVVQWFGMLLEKSFVEDSPMNFSIPDSEKGRPASLDRWSQIARSYEHTVESLCSLGGITSRPGMQSLQVADKPLKRAVDMRQLARTRLLSHSFKFKGRMGRSSVGWLHYPVEG